MDDHRHLRAIAVVLSLGSILLWMTWHIAAHVWDTGALTMLLIWPIPFCTALLAATFRGMAFCGCGCSLRRLFVLLALSSSCDVLMVQASHVVGNLCARTPIGMYGLTMMAFYGTTVFAVGACGAAYMLASRLAS